MDHCEKEKRKKNPRETANVFSLLSFAYTVSLFKKAYKNDLEEKDLYEVLTKCKSKRCGDKLEQIWLMERKKSASVSIMKLLWKRFGHRYVIFGLIDLFWKLVISFVEPTAVSNVVSYFTPGQTEISRNMAYYNAAIVLLLHTTTGIYMHNYVLFVQQLALEMKTSFSSLIYRKALKLTPSALSEISLGNIVTLITKDVHTFEKSVWIINEFWVSSIQTCVLCYLLYSRIGVVSFIGVGILLSILPVQLLIGRIVSKLRLTAGKKTDERLQITQEILSTIRIIKMYTWEKFFGNKISHARKVEMRKISLGFYLRIFIVILGNLFTKIGFYVLVMSYLWFGNSLDAKKIFYILSIFRELKFSLGILIPYAMGRSAELYSAIVRINKVLRGEELRPKTSSDEPTAKPFIEMKDAVVHIRDLEILNKISFRTNPGLTLITGTVGSGKSSLLKAMLQDYPLSSGSLVFHGRISYASQDPWLFPSSIKQNIIFGEKLDHKRYQEVVRVCALQFDFNLFDKGDETIVSDRGMNLSKGQQARVNLARAIYKNSETYLLDDSLTALDAHVQDFIFRECIKGFLKGKIVLLVSQTANHIQEADTVVIMDRGRIINCGPPTRHILEEVHELVPDDDDIEKEIVEGFRSNDIPSVGNHQLIETEQVTAKKKVYSEINKKGKVDFKTYIKYFMFGGGWILMSLNVILYGVTQFSESWSDLLLTRWVDEQHNVLSLKKNMTDNAMEGSVLAVKTNLTSFNHILSSGISTESYSILEEEKLFEEAVAKEQATIKLYSVIMILSIIFVTIQTYAIFDYCRRASVNIHKAMLTNIMNATMSFFDTHFIGNILNRFSQDMNNIDEQLPFTIREFLRVAFAVVGIIFLVASVNLQFLIYAVVFFVVTYTLRAVYIPTGRSLKRLEAATRSPMIGHLNASLEGLTTIRAYKAQDILIDEFDRHQDLYTSAHFTALTATRAFGFVVDLLCSILMTLVVIRFIFIDTGTSAGNVGLALTQVFQMSGLVQWGVRQWAELENLMTSVERLLEYTKITPETTEGTKIDNWPSRGAIKYEKVSLSYNNNETVLRDLNFEIKPKEKIGIVGRTGAGKTSIVSSIFRLYDVEGKILIDNVDTKTLNLKFLRERVAIIPQDPVLFAGTIRTNLDPFNEFKDEELWKAIDMVGLRSSVDNLEAPVSSTVSRLSSGQKQLVCLVRATLRKTKILILDEATANMDHETDVLMNEIINKIFSDCTLFVIAHRLHSILKCDKVLVMDRGEIREFDDPVSLLRNKNGLFYKMVEQAGLLSYTK